MMSNKSKKNSNPKNRTSNLFLSRNRNDNICIPLKMNNLSKNNFVSLKKIKSSSLPKVEESKKNYISLSSSNFLRKDNSVVITKKNKLEYEQTKENIILPKININSAKKRIAYNIEKKTKSFSFFKDNRDVKINNDKPGRKYSFEKNIIKKYFSISQAGKNSDGITKTNQDSYLILTRINNFTNFNVFAVFDGHGTNGHLVSQFLVTYFTDFFCKNQEIKKCKRELEVFNLLLHSNYKILRNAIISSEEKLKKEGNINIQFSGATCCMVIHINQKLICANVGDSRAILLSEMIKDDIINLSNDHKPKLKKELERIKKCGGVVERRNYGDGVVDGPFRVWNSSKQEYPGLAISRSIGDLEASNLGVIADPEFTLKTIKSNMKYIVVASDGIWEYLSNKNVCDILKPYYILGDAKGASEELIKKSTEKWAQEGDDADDITAIIIFF